MQFLVDKFRKTFPVNGQSPAGRNFAGIGCLKHQRTGQAHFLMQQSDGTVGMIIGTQRI